MREYLRLVRHRGVFLLSLSFSFRFSFLASAAGCWLLPTTPWTYNIHTRGPHVPRMKYETIRLRCMMFAISGFESGRCNCKKQPQKFRLLFQTREREGERVLARSLDFLVQFLAVLCPPLSIFLLFPSRPFPMQPLACLLVFDGIITGRRFGSFAIRRVTRFQTTTAYTGMAGCTKTQIGLNDGSLIKETSCE